jgi:hypothetical protein
MSMYRAFEIDSGLISIGGTSLTPALYISPGASADTNIVRIKVSVEAVSSPAPPSNGSVYFSLNKVSGTKAGGSSVTPTPIGASQVAAVTTWSSGSTALTGLTQGIELWGGVVPFTSGAWSEDTFENTGLECYIPASGIFSFYFISPSGAGSGCSARVIAWATE